MTHYELLFILPGTLAEDEVAPLAQKIESVVSEAGATKVVTTNVGKNRLAYPIKHIRYGYFYICRFEAEAEHVATIEHKLVLMSEPLRTMLHKYDPAMQPEVDITFNAPQREGGESTGGDITLPEMSQAPVSKKKKEDSSKKEEKTDEKVSLEDIDKKLDKILDTEIADV